MTVSASAEAMRIVRTIEVDFPTGAQQRGSAFVVSGNGHLVTCAHVVTNDAGERATRIFVACPDGSRYEASLGQVDDAHDLARLDSSGSDVGPSLQAHLPPVGEQVVFAGMPQGVARASVFPGMVSAVGQGLLSRPRCDLIQLGGMINNGNSGGPLVDAATNQVLGVITAKYVPLLQEIDRLTQSLEGIPQFPRNVGIGEIDFSAFVNLTVSSVWQVASVLRLVQVGTGWAVPTKYFTPLGVN